LRSSKAVKTTVRPPSIQPLPVAFTLPLPVICAGISERVGSVTLQDSGHAIALVQALALSIAVATPVSAQMNPIILAGPQNYAMGRVMALRSKQIQQQFDRRQAPQARPEATPPPRQASQTLAISFNPAVTKQVHDIYIGDLAKSGGAAQATEVDRRLGAIRLTFARMVAPYGLRADTLDDVMAAHMLVMWMAANQQSKLPTPAQAQAVRRQMRNVFASGAGAIAGAAERQSAAEYVMYESCMTVLVRGEVKAQPALDRKIADAVNAKMAGQGYSLRSLKLTDQGLVRG
jgi:hypothetical protein